jgi:hypothetical protein
MIHPHAPLLPSPPPTLYLTRSLFPACLCDMCDLCGLCSLMRCWKPTMTAR